MSPSAPQGLTAALFDGLFPEIAEIVQGGQEYWVIGLGDSTVSRLLAVEEYCAFQGAPQRLASEPEPEQDQQGRRQCNC